MRGGGGRTHRSSLVFQPSLLLPVLSSSCPPPPPPLPATASSASWRVQHPATAPSTRVSNHLPTPSSVSPFLAQPAASPTDALHAACSKGDPAAVAALLAAGADPVAPSPTGHSPLDIAAAASQPAVVRVLAAAVVRSGDDAAGQALTRAAVRGQAFVLKELLVCGADPDWREPGTGRTPLHWAAFSGEPALVRALLAAGAEPGIADMSGARPSDWAADRGHTVLASSLREREAKSPLDRLTSGAGVGALIALAVGAIVGAKRMKGRTRRG